MAGDLAWPRGFGTVTGTGTGTGTGAGSGTGASVRACYGGDYNPEQFTPDVWAEDIALMREAGVNLVSLGVFAWSRLEPREGEYDFGWLDRVLELLHAGGISAALATPTASPPPWFTFAHPDALPVTADGVRLSHGSRDTYCACAPAYRAAALGIATQLGRRYANHPALALWHVHNEYGTWCHCDHVATAFRGWLRERYGTLDALNEAWTTTFWSQVYGDWAHILPPRATQYLGNPAHLLDFRRFLSDELLACFREQRDALRELTPEVPVTTNLVFGAWVPVDAWAWAREVDVVAVDHYPAGVGTAAAESAFMADLARGWAGERPWLLIEQAPNLIYEDGRMLHKRPGDLTRLSLTHVARGSRGTMFFQWRAPRGGSERFHSAMVPHAGPDSRVFAEVAELGQLLGRLGPTDVPDPAEVALIWDHQCWWALQGPGLPSRDLDYLAQVQSVHSALWNAGVRVDVVAPGADVSAYKLVLAPGLYLVSESEAATLSAYVRNGGVLAVWYFSGIADTDGRIWPGGYPGPLVDVLGIRVEELHPLAPDATVELSTGSYGRQWTELVRLRGAAASAWYLTGDVAGEPAITRNVFGSGMAWYISTALDASALGPVLDSAGVAPIGPGEGVDVVRCGDRVFAMNHSAAEVELDLNGFDVVTGQAVSGVRLGPGASAIVDSLQ